MKRFSTVLTFAVASLVSALKLKESRKVYTDDEGEKHVLVSEYSG